jgi:uncharacterized protein
VPLPDPSPTGDVLVAFLSIMFEGAPYILIGTLVSGLISAYLPSGAISRFLPRRTVPAILLSGLLGIVFPVCECAVVPIIRRLVQKGLPVSCAITYMLSAPVINPVVIASTFSAFQQKQIGFADATDYGLFMTLSRLVMVYLIAVGFGLLISRVKPTTILIRRVLDDLRRSSEKSKKKEGAAKPASHSHDHAHSHGHDHSHDHAHAPDLSHGSRLVFAGRTALRDFIDVGMYFVIGVMLTAIFNARVPFALLEPFAENPALASPALITLSFILSLCSTTDAFIAAQLPFDHAAKLSFLVYGPMMDVKLVFLYMTVFRRRFVFTMVFTLALATFALALGWGSLIAWTIG